MALELWKTDSQICSTEALWCSDQGKGPLKEHRARRHDTLLKGRGPAGAEG